jgi:hypothetical protein
MSAPPADPVLDALVAASEALLLQSPPPRPPPPRGAVGFGGVVGVVEPAGTTSSKLYGVSDDIDCSDNTLCFGLIGAGSAFCVRKNCGVKSHSQSKISLAGGPEKYVFIRRNAPGTVFSRPSLLLDKIPQGTRDDWATKFLPLSEWTLKFQAVENTNDATATEDVIKEETLFLSRAELLKTPAKRKRDPSEESRLSVWQGPKLERTFPSPGDDLDAFIDVGVTKQKLVKMVASVESNIESMNKGVVELALLTHNRFANSEASVDTLMGILQSLKSRVGEAVDIEDSFAAPTLWGTTSFIADEVVSLRLSHDELSGEFKPLKQSLTDLTVKAALEGKDVQKRFTTIIEVVSSMMTKVQSMAPVIEGIKEDLSRLSGNTKSVGNPPRSAIDEFFHIYGGRDLGADSPDRAAPRLANVLESSSDWKTDPEFVQLLADVHSLKSTVNETTAIKFAGLGLRDVKDTTRWVEKNFSGLRYGLILDPLLMLERIYGDDEVDSGSFLKSMETRLKLKIETGAEASALNALRHARPRIFHKGRPCMVNLPNKSRLNLLAAHKDWKSGGEGIENFIITKMNVLYSSISSDIANELGNDAGTMEAHFVATKCLTATVTFITQLIATINSIYERLFTFSKFTTEQAWSLTTQVLDRIMSDLYDPKDGVIESLSTGNPVSTCGHILWASFRTHEVMTTYVEHQFENHPAISTEYVKFLATNSGSEKVAKLALTVEGVQAKAIAASSEASKASSKADTSSAKCAEMGKEIASLVKRIKTLEDRK